MPSTEEALRITSYVDPTVGIPAVLTSRVPATESTPPVMPKAPVKASTVGAKVPVLDCEKADPLESVRPPPSPTDTVPLFVKAGSILPTGPAVNFVGQAGGETIKYDVYPDKDGVAAGHLYQDDGITPAYLKGACEHFSLKFKDGKATSTSSKDNAEKPLPATAIDLH